MYKPFQPKLFVHFITSFYCRFVDREKREPTHFAVSMTRLCGRVKPVATPRNASMSNREVQPPVLFELTASDFDFLIFAILVLDDLEVAESALVGLARLTLRDLLPGLL